MLAPPACIRSPCSRCLTLSRQPPSHVTPATPQQARGKAYLQRCFIAGQPQGCCGSPRAWRRSWTADASQPLPWSLPTVNRRSVAAEREPSCCMVAHAVSSWLFDSKLVRRQLGAEQQSSEDEGSTAPAAPAAAAAAGVSVRASTGGCSSEWDQEGTAFCQVAALPLRTGSKAAAGDAPAGADLQQLGGSGWPWPAVARGKEWEAADQQRRSPVT